MSEILFNSGFSPVLIIILSVSLALLGVWGRNRSIMRRIRELEDDVTHLTERFDRANKIKGGRASAEARDSNLREAQEIAALANMKPLNQPIVLPGRRTA